MVIPYTSINSTFNHRLYSLTIYETFNSCVERKKLKI